MSRISPQAQPAIKLNDVFWSRFSQGIWEKKSATFRNIDSPLVQLDEAHIFDLLVLYSDRCRKLKSIDGFKFYVAGERQHDEEILQILPEKRDKSLQGYHKRMSRIFADYCLVCDELLQVSRAKWELLAEFTRGLYKHVGFPNRFAEMGLYLGNYRRTPFGVHVDGCGVFSFPVVGHKKFRVWKPEYVKKNTGLVEAHEYSRHKNHSELLIAEPGDMTYWPSSAWHIAESDGAFSAAWSLGIWVDKTHQEVIAEALTSLAQRTVGSQGAKATTPFRKLHKNDGEVKALPQLYLESLAQLQSLPNGALEESLLKSWMVLTSKQGFKTLPQVMTKSKLSLRDSVQNRSKHPVLWTYLKSESRYIYFYDGSSVESLTSPDFLKLIKALNSGKICRLSQFLKGSRSALDLKALQVLADAGAIEPVSNRKRKA